MKAKIVIDFMLGGKFSRVCFINDDKNNDEITKLIHGKINIEAEQIILEDEIKLNLNDRLPTFNRILFSINEDC